MATSTGLANLIDSLPNNANPSEVLEELKTILIATNAETLRDVVRNISFHAIFDCLNTRDECQLSVCCCVLELLLEALDAGAILNEFSTEVLAGLGHPAACVKHLALRQMLRASTSCSHQMGQHEDLLVQLVSLLADDNLAVAEYVAKITKNLAGSTEGLSVLFQPAVQHQFVAALEKGDTIKFRAYEAIIQMACESAAALQGCSSAGYLQQLLNELYRDDVLLQLNALELLKALALCPHGLLYLDQQGVITRLEDMLKTVDDNPMGAFLLPGLVKFFGNIGHLHPKEICSRFQGFARRLFQLVSSNDVGLRLIALETIGFIATTPEGKMALQKQGPEMTSACKQLGRDIQEGSNETRNKAVEALANIIHVQVCDQSSMLLGVTEAWFLACHTQPLEMLMSIVRQPFPELRCGVLSVFSALANLPWGQRMLNAYPGFNEYLLDRNTEKSKETKEAKYAVVKTLAESPTTLGIFGQPYQLQLRHFVNEGPFYVRVQAAVAFEEAS